MKKDFKIGKVYFSHKEKQFIKIYEHEGEVYHCGNFTNYYSDSKTVVSRMPVSKDYLEAMDLKEVISLDKIGNGVDHDGIGWRFIEPKDKTNDEPM